MIELHKKSDYNTKSKTRKTSKEDNQTKTN